MRAKPIAFWPCSDENLHDPIPQLSISSCPDLFSGTAATRPGFHVPD